MSLDPSPHTHVFICVRVCGMCVCGNNDTPKKFYQTITDEAQTKQVKILFCMTMQHYVHLSQGLASRAEPALNCTSTALNLEAAAPTLPRLPLSPAHTLLSPSLALSLFKPNMDWTILTWGWTGGGWALKNQSKKDQVLSNRTKSSWRFA